MAKVASEPYPDASQFDPASPYVDPKSRPERPKWWLVDVQLVEKTRLLSLAEMRLASTLATMTVTDAEWAAAQVLLHAVPATG